MPNVKLYVNERVKKETTTAIFEKLGSIRELLCSSLSVPASACQIDMISTKGLSDQPQLNIEIAYLAKPKRTKPAVENVCKQLQEMVVQIAKMHVAVRAVPLDATTYVALK